MPSTPVSRYNNIAISLHWLMAFLILAMLIVGKFMVSLDETSPLRFSLTQTHKAFGILILLLAIFRLLWRLSHRSPSHPADAPAWERFAAHASHIALYALMFMAPITGWMLVSVSPLNIDTLLFNVIPWPHLPWLHDVVDKASTETQYAQYHEWATGAMIALLLLHIAAGLKHHFVNKDTVLTRIAPSKEHKTGKTLGKLVAVLVLGIGGAVLGFSQLQSSGDSFSAGNSAVRAIASVMGEATDITFADSVVSASINTASPESSTLEATVPTASVSSSNQQVQGSLPDVDWFDSESHPNAQFVADNIEALSDGQFLVSGTLTIKGIAQTQRFELNIAEVEGARSASGQFTVDRTAYQLGMESQPNDDYVGNEVTIVFEFALSE